MTQPTDLDAATIRRVAALAGLELTSEQAADHTAALQELLNVDAAIAALKLGSLPAVGLPWGDGHAADRRG